MFVPPLSRVSPRRKNAALRARAACLGGVGALVVAGVMGTAKPASAFVPIRSEDIGWLAQTSNEYSTVQKTWQTFNALQFNYGLSDRWALVFRPSGMLLSNEALAAYWHMRVVGGVAFALPLEEGEPMRYHVFTAGAGYQYTHTKGPDSNPEASHRSLFAGELYAEYWLGKYIDLSLNHSLNVGKLTIENTGKPSENSFATYTMFRAAGVLTGDNLDPYWFLLGAQAAYDNERRDGIWRRESWKIAGCVPFRANWGGQLLFLTAAAGPHISRDNFDQKTQKRTGTFVALEAMVGFF